MTTKPFHSYGNPVKIIMCAQKRDERIESCQLLVDNKKYYETCKETEKSK